MSNRSSQDSDFSFTVPDAPDQKSPVKPRPGISIDSSRILENARLQAAVADMLDDDDDMSINDSPRKCFEGGDEQLNSAREFAARGREFVESEQYKMMETAGKQTITGDWPSESILNTLDREMRRVTSSEDVATLANRLASFSASRCEALLNVVMQCSCRHQLDNMFTCLLKLLSETRFSPKFDQVMACLAMSAHCSFESLLPGGETVPEAADYLDRYLMSSAQSSTSMADDERLDECRAGLERLFRVLELAYWDQLNSEEITMVLFALLRISLDRVLEHRRFLIVPVLNKILAEASQIDQGHTKLMDVIESFKRVFLHLSPSLSTVARASELLSLMDAANQSDKMVVACVREVLSSQAELSDPGDLDADLTALCASFSALVEEESFRSNRCDLWAALMLLNDGLSPRVIEAANEQEYRNVERLFTTVSRRLIKSHFIDDQIIDALLRSIVQRFTVTWANAHPGDNWTGTSLPTDGDHDQQVPAAVSSSPKKKRMCSDSASAADEQ